MLDVRHVTKTYRKDGQIVRAADDLSFRLSEGDLAVIHGPSGSGKSTLLLIAGGMLAPDAGSVLYESDDIYRWPARRRNAYRRQAVGFVFQRFFLVPYLTVADNIRMPWVLQGTRSGWEDALRDVATRLRIGHRLGHRPAELSAGEQQRAAVARALAGGQKLILADEPTGNLDPENAQIIADCLREESRRGRIVLLVTHNPALTGIGSESLRLEQGRIVDSHPAKTAPAP